MEEAKVTTELERLKEMLERDGIPFKWTVEPKMMRLEYPNGKRGKGGRVLSAIQGEGTFGGKSNLIEIMGLPRPEDKPLNGVVGWLTADNVYERISKHYAKKQQQ